MTTMTQDGVTLQGQDGPTPEDIEAASELPRLLLGRLVGDWHEARRRLDRAEELAQFDSSLAPWVAVEGSALAATERVILQAIRVATVATGRRTARGFHWEGVTFMAFGPGDHHSDWELVVLPGETFDLGREFPPDRKRSTIGPATEQPAWLLRALGEVERLGADEARRRLYGLTSGPLPQGWGESLAIVFREWGRRETFRRLGLDGDAVAQHTRLPVAPTSASWVVSDHHGQPAGHQVVMARETWEALPVGYRPGGVWTTDRRHIFYEIDAAGRWIAPPGMTSSGAIAEPNASTRPDLVASA